MRRYKRVWYCEDGLDEDYAINDLVEYLEENYFLSYPYTNIKNDSLIIYGKWVTTERRAISNYVDIKEMLDKYARKNNLSINKIVIKSIESRDNYAQQRAVLEVRF